ncbi:MAG: alkaline phosphatase [Chlorobiaceae bacterium]|nr:alkaline phosphatase [Chlorobiaceae bacterium]
MSRKPANKPNTRVQHPEISKLTIWRRLFTLLLLFVAISSAGATPAADTGRPKRIRYVFLFIGDGMGPAQVSLAESLMPDGKSLAMTSFPVLGTALTHSANRLITDSGAGGTALATGFKTTNGTISMAANRLDTLRTIAEMARSKGMKTGIVTSVGIDNATPACFYAHNPDRDNYYDIAVQMASSRFDYFGGGYAEGDFPGKRARSTGFRGPIPGIMEKAGYRIARTLEELRSIHPGTPAWAYAPYDRKAAMDFEMDRSSSEMDLAAFTREGIRLLDNPAGFFMMVEGGKIDWACHSNDATAAARDVQAFDTAIREAIAFWKRHPSETLIIVTADHECGGLALGNLANGYTIKPELLKNQRISSQRLAEKAAAWKQNGTVSYRMALDSVRVWYGLAAAAPDTSLVLKPDELTRLGTAFSDQKPDTFAGAVTRILNERAGIGWTTNAHTMLPVQVFAMGAGSAEFGGIYDNTAIARKIMKLARIGSAGK